VRDAECKRKPKRLHIIDGDVIGHGDVIVTGVKKVKVKVKWTLVQALKLWTGRTAHRGSRGIALLFLDHGTRRG